MNQMFQGKDNISSLKQEMIWSAVLHIALFSYGIIYGFLPKPKHPILVAVEIAGEGELRRILDADGSRQKRIEQILRQQSEKENLQDKNARESKREDKIEEKKAEKNPNETSVPHAKNKKNPLKKRGVKKKSQKTIKDAIKKVSAQKKWRAKLNEIAKKSEEEIKKKEEPSKKAENVTNSGNNGGATDGIFGSVSDAETENISSQIYPHWAVPSGIKDAENFVIEIRVKLKDTGEVIPADIEILDRNRYANDYIFRAAADSARRAILEASPLHISRDKIGLFREFIFRFNVKEALGG